METEYITYMSIEQPLDTQLIEQTKQQIRSLVAEIAQLSKTDVAPEEFYGEFLPRVVSALAAVGGAVWTLNPEGQLALQYQINLQETKLRDNEEGQAQHSRLLYKALAGGEGMLVPPHSGPGDADQLDPGDAGRQSHRFPAGARPAEDRPGDGGRWSRSFSAPRPGRARRRAICGSCCKCASWPATSSRATSCATSPIARRCGPSWKISPAGSTPRSIRARPPTPSPTRAGG